jgi:hypothetical protein
MRSMGSLKGQLRWAATRFACGAPLLLFADPGFARGRSWGWGGHWRSVQFSWEGVALTIAFLAAIIAAGCMQRRRSTASAAYAYSDRFKDNLVRWRWRAWRRGTALWIVAGLLLAAIAFGAT